MHTLFEASESTVKVLAMSHGDVMAILPLIQPVLDDHMKYLAVQALLPFSLESEVDKLVEAFREEHFSKKQVRPLLLVPRREYSHWLVSYWSGVGEYSHWLVSYWSHGGNILTGLSLIGPV
jgi:hypothetical protein